MDAVKNARAYQIFQRPFVDRPVVQPSGKILDGVEAAVLGSVIDQTPHGSLAHVLYGRQRVADGAGFPLVLHAEQGTRGVDVGRQQFDAQPVDLLAEDTQFIRIVNIEGHGRGEKLHRIVGL